MNSIIVNIFIVLTILIGILGFIALMFASLPGAEISYSLSDKIIRGLLYTYPVVVLASIILIKKYAQINSFALAWVILPLVPVAIVWFIFSMNSPK